MESTFGGIRYKNYRGERDTIHKALGHAKISLAGIRKNITRIEAHAGMAERLVKDLAIEEGLQIKIKSTIAHNN